ncbi:MAG: DUF2188 domain-containing protein [Bacteroidetes bacterium]|nr:DUF2188 domain-containing protein [Bacteroidota bacterium]
MPTKEGWGVKGQGNSKLTAKTETKADALKIGKEIAKNQQSELTILGKDGKIQNKSSFGNDPLPSKDNKH